VIGILLTLAVLCWYTVETVRLRRAAQQQNQVSVQPVLAVYIKEFAMGNPRQIVIENVGQGVAFNVTIRQPSNQLWTITLKNNLIAPGKFESLEFRQSQSLVLVDQFPAKMHNLAAFVIAASCVGVDNISRQYEFSWDPDNRTIKYGKA
jgi:hypothetical protein